MKNWIEEKKKKSIDWWFSVAQGKFVTRWFSFFAFTESIIMPIPTVAFMVPILMAGAKKWLYYAVLATGFSVLGGVVGYGLALLFFDTLGVQIIEFYHLGAEVERVKGIYEDNAFWVTLTGAFTPLPYKIFVLTAGFLKINIITFIIASIIGRGLQFFIVGYVMGKFGPQITKVFLKYFNTSLIVIGVAGLLYIFFH